MQTSQADALDRAFLEARTHNAWLDQPVDEALLRRVHEVARMGPTSADCSPMRVAFVRSKAAKERLRPALSAGNLAKTMAAPVTAIIAYDLKFYEHLPRLFPHDQTARSWFEGKPNVTETAFRNGTLQGAYFIVAARMLGLDCGPMSGFDNARVDAAFFPDSSIRSNFLINLGYGDPAGLFARSPRFAFEEVCRVE